jgi:hypothetical protein
MFLDLAYVVRVLLKQIGYGNPEVVGIFFLPRVEAGLQAQAVGNAYAALTELNHFSSPGTIFSANYDTKDATVLGPINDPDAPFSRCIFLPMPYGRSEIQNPKVEVEKNHSNLSVQSADAHALASHFLVADLITSLGRCGDASRRDNLAGRAGLTCQTFGMHRIVWPRKSLLTEAASYLCRQLVTCWMSKDPAPVRTRVREWIGSQWTNLAIEPEHLIAALQQACDKALGKTPESAFAALFDPIKDFPLAEFRVPTTSTNLSLSHDKPKIEEVIERLEQWIGKPPQPSPKEKGRKPGDERVEDEGLRTSASLLRGPERDALLLKALGRAGEELTANFGQRLAELAVCLIEKPGYRIAGAEEAIRQMTQKLEQVLHQQELLAHEIYEQTLSACEKIGAALKTLQAAAQAARDQQGNEHRAERTKRSGRWFRGGGGGSDDHLAPEHLATLLRQYAKQRLQPLILERVIFVYVSLRGQLSDQMREIGFCRNRLNELCRSLESGSAEPDSGQGLSPQDQAPPTDFGDCLFAPGCVNLESAVRKLLAQVSAEDMERLDCRLETVICELFAALVHVCLGSSNMLKDLAAVMRKEGENLLAEKLTGANVVEMYLARVKTSASLPLPAGAGGQYRARPEKLPEHRGESILDSLPVTGCERLAADPLPVVLSPVERAITRAFDLAAPDLNAVVAPGRLAQPSEVTILSAPQETSDQTGTLSFKDTAKRLLAKQSLIVTDSQDGIAADEILFYREETCLTLSDLKLLGPVGREAYRQMNNVEHFTPHSWIDITEWFPAV